MGKSPMRWGSLNLVLLVIVAYGAGIFSHLLYERWTSTRNGGQSYQVEYVPFSKSPAPEEIPQLEAIDLPSLRAIAGTRARVRGKVFRVGHSERTNTYFINFGPSRSSLTGVIFSSAVARFEDRGIKPRIEYEGKEVEITGRVKDHPEYGLEIILEDPSQVTVIR